MNNSDGSLTAAHMPQHVEFPHIAPGVMMGMPMNGHTPLYGGPNAHAPVDPALDVPTAPRGYRDSYTWRLVKHAAQLGVIAAAVSFVFEAGRSPVLSVVYAITSLTFLSMVALVDGQRFVDSARTVERPTVQIPGQARSWAVAAPVDWYRPDVGQQQLAEQQYAQRLSNVDAAQSRPQTTSMPFSYDMASVRISPVSVT